MIPHPVHVVLGIKLRVLRMVDKTLYPLAYISSLELKLFNQKLAQKVNSLALWRVSLRSKKKNGGDRWLQGIHLRV